MKLTEISFTPSAAVVITNEEIELLCECSEAHYDGFCRAASRHGGFLFGMRNYAENAPNSPHVLAWRELDTLAKIAEVGQHMGEKKAKSALAIGLKLRRILDALIEATPEPVVCA